MFIVLILVQTLWLTKSVLSLSIEEGSLRTLGLARPNGISTLTPTLSWRLTGQSRNDSQVAFQLQAATSAFQLTTNRPNLWDTGKLTGAKIFLNYAGTELSSRDVVYWRVRAWSATHGVSRWSEPTTFELGLLESSDWSAQWITNPAFSLGNTSLPAFATSFDVDCSVAKARLYALGLGVQAVIINGASISDDILAPGYSNTNITLLYTTYNITTLLNRTTNTIQIELGRGEWDTQSALGGRYMKYKAVPTSLKMIAQLEYTCTNGTTVTVASKDTWKTSVDGPLLESSWYGGEEYVATKSYNISNLNRWDNATVTTSPPGILKGPDYPPLKVVGTLTPTNVSGPIFGQYIIDFGINFAGWYTLMINETKDTRVTMWPCERLLSNGGLDQSTTGSPIYNAFTSAGVAQVYSPKFMYHGFRYLAVNTTSPPSISNANGLIIRTDSETVGKVETSDYMINEIHSIIDRAIQSNIYTVMTDCPHREKLGWLEQSHLVFQPVTRGYDIQAFGRGIVRTILDSQTTNGLIPDIAPEFVVFANGYRDDPNWGNAVVLLPLMLYQAYGDIDLLEEAYVSMEAYVAFLSRKSTNGTLACGLGDWIAFDTSTPLGITATFGYYQALVGMKQIAAALGKSADSEAYAARINTLLASFQENYLVRLSNGAYYYGSNSQASNVIALDIGVVSSPDVDTTVQNLVDAIMENSNHLSVGEIALPFLFRVLQIYGKNDIIYKMMTSTTSPSYAYQVLHGATSLTERWDGPTASCSGCNSLNHFMLGYGDQWIVELSGLAQANTSVMWDTINYSPNFVTNMTSASSSYRSLRGLASAAWTRRAELFTYDIIVPVGVIGLVTLDVLLLGLSNVTESGVAISTGCNGNGIFNVTTSPDTVLVMVGSGEYQFLVS